VIRKYVMALAILAAVLPVAAHGQCVGEPGTHVALVSNNYDPDVLVWDSKQRLLNYAAGGWSVARVLLPHALLARAGTRAVIVSCLLNVVHPKYQLVPADAAGVKLTSGPYKGRYGWVMAADLRVRR
jgi:hypothetical protein